MPKLWNETIETHRRDVRDAILDATSTLVAESGLRSVTMSLLAEKANIGRATLYKYFPDVEAILLAWHQRQIASHLESLIEARDKAGKASERLRAVLEAYGFISLDNHGHHDAELAKFLHHDHHVRHAQKDLFDLIRTLLTEAKELGTVRKDITMDELTTYCLHALAGAATLTSRAAVTRLVDVILRGLSPRS
jgi:AcrR family transcriptional regulator